MGRPNAKRPEPDSKTVLTHSTDNKLYDSVAVSLMSSSKSAGARRDNWEYGTYRMAERSVDEKLVRQVQHGDKAAFDLLVRKYQLKVSKLISRYVRDRREVEDVTQEAFIKAYRAIAGFRNESAFYTWLYRIAVNTAKNYLESLGRRPPATDVEVETAEFSDGAEGLREQDTPERHMLTDEIASTVNRVLNGLPGDLRTAITLREID